MAKEKKDKTPPDPVDESARYEVNDADKTKARKWFARAALGIIDTAGVDPEDICAIGSHGQTVHHLPEVATQFGVSSRSTLQIGNASVIAERTGIRTVSDFRSRDLAAGGQGAPLVPLVDFLLFRSETVGRALVNIGGITNVTVLPAGCGPDDVVAFDTGPGNVIIDSLVVRMTHGTKGFDESGQIAESGNVRDDLLAKCMEHPYFKLAPPKSTGREMFGGDFVDHLVEAEEGTEL
ncbi:MAG: anhydro-N-acetylmuramic acid kinase [Candidatus Hydrogenedentes bacterium]|nr:anhydro-N-acetylmuramic acid kinase [Candidatus Hydrogenedentota bacterium]